jgi:hypothetical protein
MEITLGYNAKLTAPPQERAGIRSFYGDFLGFKAVRQSERADIFRLGPTFCLAFLYEAPFLSAAEKRNGLWLELRTTDVAGLRAMILNHGVDPIDYWDKEHFYFQAPGGQVFRLAGMNEETPV